MTSSRTEPRAGAGAGLVEVTMPQMGVSVAEGTIVEWRRGVGERIEADETICEISTDKIDTEVPAPVGGTVVEILVGVGETVDVGTVLARIAAGAAGEEADTAGGSAATAPETATAPASVAPTREPAPPGTSAATSGSMSATSGAMSAGTSGATAAHRAAPAAGSESAPAPPSPSPPARSESNGAPGASARTARGEPGGPAHAPRAGYSPVVRRMAEQHGVDLDLVSGTGRDGRVRKQDVQAFIEADGGGAKPLHIESPYRPDPAAGGAHPALAAVLEATGAPLSRMRRSIGEHMKRSQELAATCTTWIEVDMSRIEAARAAAGLTALPYVARATVAALRAHPRLNAWFEDERYTQHADVNLGIAVSLGEDGLIVPVVHGAQDLSVEGLSRAIRDLARRARARELTHDEVRGGTFTITNPGQYGSIMATPVINQPQVAILDLEAVVKRPVVVAGTDGQDAIAIRPMTILGLSWDHRALDGALSAQFLAAVKRHLEAWDGAA